MFAPVPPPITAPFDQLNEDIVPAELKIILPFVPFAQAGEVGVVVIV